MHFYVLVVIALGTLQIERELSGKINIFIHMWELDYTGKWERAFIQNHLFIVLKLDIQIPNKIGTI